MAVKLARSRGETSSLSSGSVVAGKYRIERVLGEGGMGTVYAAHHELLDQRVALKVLFEDAMRDKEASARFLQEARSAARLQSEHVARVMDIDTLENGLPFIVMEYLEGNDLGQYLERRTLFPVATVVDYVIQALEAISQAHAQGIIHRDLKPSNLFLAAVPDGSQIIKVLDFGISKPTFGGSVSRLTSSRSVLGSPPYMSPEQVRSPRTVDTRTDIWSIGILLYEVLTAQMPFEGEEVGELFAAILEQEPRGIRVLRSDVPEGVERVIFKCLAKHREQRYVDVAELARALAPFGTGAQAKSVEKIASTLLRGEELTNPSKRRAISGVTPVASAEALDNTTVPDDPGAARLALIADEAPAPELSPTASTVGRKRTLFTFRHGSTRTKIAAFMGGGLAALLAVIVLVLMSRSGTRAPAPAVPPPEPSAIATHAAEDPKAEIAATPVTTAVSVQAALQASPTPAGGQPAGTLRATSPKAKPALIKPPLVATKPSSPLAPAKASPADQDGLKKNIGADKEVQNANKIFSP